MEDTSRSQNSHLAVPQRNSSFEVALKPNFNTPRVLNLNTQHTPKREMRMTES